LGGLQREFITQIPEVQIESHSMQRALLIMAKQPLAGHTKTRLCPPLTADKAAQLYDAFLRDVVTIARTVPRLIHGVQPHIAYAPGGDPDFFAALAPDFDLIAQRGETLGVRLDHVLVDCLAQGYDQVVAINSDSPTLPPAYIAQAFTRLESPQTDAVFGPCEDGGYYLIGVSAPHPRLVRDVQMSTPHVLRDTLALADEEGLTVALTPSWYDVDTVDDLTRLQHELTQHAHQSAVNTRDFLVKHGVSVEAQLR